MILNIEKTNIMHFQLRRCTNLGLNINFNGTAVPQVEEVKYLGFVIDSALTWTPHIDAMCSKLASACYALARVAPSLTMENLRKVYYGYFQSILTYGIDLWGTAADRERPLRLQKRAIRTITGSAPDQPAQSLFRQNHILTLPCLYILEVSKYVRRHLHKLPTNAEHLNSNSRRRHHLYVPARRLAKSSKSLRVMGPKIYNAIPNEIKEAPSDTTFTSKLKKLLADMPFYTVDEVLTKILKV
jgi:hypothetical protein